MIRFLQNYKSILLIIHFLITFLIIFLGFQLEHLGITLFYILAIIFGLYLNNFYNYQFSINQLKEYFSKYLKTIICAFIPFMFFLFLFEFNKQYYGDSLQLLTYLITTLALIIIFSAILNSILSNRNEILTDLTEGLSIGLLPQMVIVYLLCDTIFNVTANNHYNLYILKDYNILIKAIIILPVLLLSLILVNYIYYHIKKSNRPKIIVLGCTEEAQDIINQLALLPDYLYKLEGCIPCNEQNALVEKKYIIENVNNIEDFCLSNNIDLIIKASTAEIKLSEVNLFHSEIVTTLDIFEEISNKIPLKYVDTTWLINNINLKNRFIYNIHKRIMDIITSTIVLIATLPAMLFLYIQIKLIDNGPFLFVNDRLGKDGKAFNVFKVRTMIENAQEKMFVIYEGEGKDPRWLPGASIVRSTRLDEIPQMINILQGTMSIVGPRPDSTIIKKELELLHPLQKSRRLIKPGWTGWAQIYSGHFETLEESIKKVDYDLYYLKNCSLTLDLVIFFRALILISTNSHK